MKWRKPVICLSLYLDYVPFVSNNSIKGYEQCSHDVESLYNFGSFGFDGFHLDQLMDLGFIRLERWSICVIHPSHG